MVEAPKEEERVELFSSQDRVHVLHSSPPNLSVCSRERESVTVCSKSFQSLSKDGSKSSSDWEASLKTSMSNYQLGAAVWQQMCGRESGGGGNQLLPVTVHPPAPLHAREEEEETRRKTEERWSGDQHHRY